MQFKLFSGGPFIVLVLFVCVFGFSNASVGDRSDEFQRCKSHCLIDTCTHSGLYFRKDVAELNIQTKFEKLLRWSCLDECRYKCMWQTVETFTRKGLHVPQFYGKWPFKRILGIQEPASVVFSVFNFIEHIRGIKKLRSFKSDNYCFKIYLIFSLINLNGWIWSIVFHARDTDLTEMLDYAFAYSIVLSMLFIVVMRAMKEISLILRGLVGIFFLSYYLNYFAYLSTDSFSYSDNMKLNIVTGVVGAIGWFTFLFVHRKHCRYYYKTIVQFYVLFTAAMSLEILDFKPVWWVFDSHSLWHCATAPLIHLIYKFFVEDCQALEAQKKELLTKII